MSCSTETIGSIYGFAVVKSTVSQDFFQTALTNTLHYSFPLTVVKEVVYAKDFTGLVSEKIILVLNPNFHDKGFKDALIHVVEAACKAFHGNDCVTTSNVKIILRGIQSQTPRLLLMPLIEEIVKEYFRFVYAFRIDKYISLGFLSEGHGLYGSPGEENVVHTGISYVDAKLMLQRSKKYLFSYVAGVLAGIPRDGRSWRLLCTP